MTVMLRGLGIPARLVNGFAGGVNNPISGLHVIRSRDAHSWVEAYIPGYGWLEFDPTPPAPDALMNPWVAQLWMYWDALQSAWGDWVLEYDFAHQLELARAVQGQTRDAAFYVVRGVDENLAFARRFWESLRSFAGGSPSQGSRWLLLWIVAALAAVVAATVAVRNLVPAWRRARRARRLQTGHGLPSDSAFFYRRALKILDRRGLQRRPWQTAEEFSRTAADSELRGLLDQITAAYSAARFGRNREAEQRLPRLVQALERTRS
jgi:hypothetical protein